MRTTITLDDDVAAALKRLRKVRGQRFKDLVNEVLRHGLRHLSAPPERREPFRTRVVSLGRCRSGSVDSVADALSFAEGESFK
jgi:hypothetical protein